MPVLGVVHSTKIGPDAPTITTVTDVGLNREYDNGAVDVAFTLPAVNTAVSYKVTSSNGQVATGASSPIRVQNLPTGINTTFTITGVNVITIEGPPSATSTGVVVTTVPYRPTMGVATAGNGQAFVVFTLLNSGGKQVISYVATGSPAGTANNTGSPITVPNLNNDVPHAFTVVAVNANGSSLASNPSNVVTPSTGGGGVPAGTYYCYSSDCFSQDGVTFAYLQAPIFTSVSPSDQSTTTPYSGGFGFARGTRVTYCNTVEATAATGARQADCQANYIPPDPPTPCDPTEYTSECGTYTTGPQVPGCSPTSADYGYTVTQTASKTRTIYDCNGIIISTTLIPCTISTFTSTTTNDPRCPGYRAQAVSSGVSNRGQTNVSPPPPQGTQAAAGSTVVYSGTTLVRDPSGAGFTDPGTGATSTWYSAVDRDGNTQLYLIPESSPGVPTTTPTVPDVVIEKGAFDYWSNPNTQWNWGTTTGETSGFIDLGLNIDYDALNAFIAQYEQPTTTAPAVDTTTSSSSGGGYGGCFLFGTKITMADGSFKNIEDLKLGDELLTFRIPGLIQSDNSDDWYPSSKWSTNSTADFTKTTTKVSHMRTGPFWRHYVINGQYRVTYEHLIFAKRENTYQFIRVDGLQIGDYFLDANKKEIEITNIEEIHVMESTVELDVEENDMYFADGILVHNFYDYGGGGKA
jgi:hypothetical protein